MIKVIAGLFVVIQFLGVIAEVIDPFIGDESNSRTNKKDVDFFIDENGDLIFY